MSLRGFAAFGYDEDENDLLFRDKQVSYDIFVYSPSILNDPRLVFRYNNRYFAATHSSPLLPFYSYLNDLLKKRRWIRRRKFRIVEIFTLMDVGGDNG